jgi:hypothetical protein
LLSRRLEEPTSQLGTTGKTHHITAETRYDIELVYSNTVTVLRVVSENMPNESIA